MHKFLRNVWGNGSQPTQPSPSQDASSTAIDLERGNLYLPRPNEPAPLYPPVGQPMPNFTPSAPYGSDYANYSQYVPPSSSAPVPNFTNMFPSSNPIFSSDPKNPTFYQSVNSGQKPSKKSVADIQARLGAFLKGKVRDEDRPCREPFCQNLAKKTSDLCSAHSRKDSLKVVTELRKKCNVMKRDKAQKERVKMILEKVLGEAEQLQEDLESLDISV